MPTETWQSSPEALIVKIYELNAFLGMLLKNILNWGTILPG